MSPPLQEGSLIAEPALVSDAERHLYAIMRRGGRSSIRRCEKGKKRGINRGSTQEELREEAALKTLMSS